MVSSEESPLTLSSLPLCQVGICEVALLFAVLRWFLCWGFRLLRNRRDHGIMIQTSTSETQTSSSAAAAGANSSCWLSSQMIRDRYLMLTSFDDIKERLPDTWDTCAVCLNQLKMRDEVRELRNCCHVFHKECIDRWLDHDQDNHNRTCPLCRAPLLSSPLPSESSCCIIPAPQPSWAVERLIYLFGDDLPRC